MPKLYPELREVVSVPAGLILKFGLFKNIRRTQLRNRHDCLRCWTSCTCLEEFADQSFELLWELFWSQPDVLDHMISRLVIPDSEQYRDEQTRSQPFFAQPHIQAAQALFYPWRPLLSDGLAWDTIFLETIYRHAEALPTFNASKFLAMFAHMHQPGAGLAHNACCRCDLVKSSRYRSPSLEGIRSTLKQYYESCYTALESGTTIWAAINSLAPDHDIPPTQAGKSIVSTRLQATATNALIVLAPSGAGKTFSMLQYLSSNLGLYFQSCMLPLLPESGIHRARRRSGSKDSYHLGQFITFILSFWESLAKSDIDELSVAIYEALDRLLTCRIFALTCFLRLCNGHPEIYANSSLARLWLRIQTSDVADIFTPLFQVATLVSILEKEYLQRTLHRTQIFAKAPKFPFSLAFCLDEAQMDMDISIFSPSFGETRSLLAIWSTAFMTLSLDLQESGEDEQPLSPRDTILISGTSLALKRAEQDIKNIADIGDVDQDDMPFQWKTASLFNLPQLRSHADFEILMGGLQGRLGTRLRRWLDSPVIRNRIRDCSTPLLGRPRWSLLYLRRVCDFLDSDLESNQSGRWHDSIAAAANTVFVEVTNDLYYRLERLEERGKKDPRYHVLMGNLGRVVISQELLDSGHGFMDDIDRVLITEGFAYMAPVEKGGFKQVINEALAIQAAKWLFLRREAGRDMIHKQINTMIEAQQGDHSALGKVAEWFLAWNLYRAFKKNESRCLGSQESNRHDRIISALNQAVSCNAGAGIWDLSRYSVVEGGTIGYMYSTQVSCSVSMSAWMDVVVNSRRPTSTYYFPAEVAGPDIVFAMQPPPGATTSLIIVLVQMKIARDVNATEANETTNLSKSYHNRETNTVLKGYEDARNDLDSVVLRWEQSPSPPTILRVLFTAATIEGKVTTPRSGTKLPEYYVRLDQKSTSKFFGPEFNFLLNYWRKRDQTDFRNARESLQVYQKLADLM